MTILAYRGDTCLEVVSATGQEYIVLGTGPRAYQRLARLVSLGATGRAWRFVNEYEVIRREVM